MCVVMMTRCCLYEGDAHTSVSSEYFANNNGADGAHAGMLITGDYFCFAALNIIRICILLCIKKMHNRGTPQRQLLSLLIFVVVKVTMCRI